MGALEGRVAIITGAGRGLGRAHALLFAAEGARVVVNDLGGESDGTGENPGTAASVVAEIEAAGGTAVASTADVASWTGGREVVEQAIDSFGALDVLVNNAGILRDRSLVSMTEADWDDVVTVHLKGHFVPSKFAAEYWRSETKAGRTRQASVISTSSTSGLLGNPGQANYGAAKAGVAAFSSILEMELGRYGVRSNCVVPAARTRLTEATPGLSDMVAAPSDDTSFDLWDPANVSPLVAYLATADCPIRGRMLFVQGGTIRFMEGWSFAETLEQSGRWTIESLAEGLAPYA